MTSRQFFFGLANNLHRAIKRNDLFVGHDCQCSQRQETRDVFSERGVSEIQVESEKRSVPPVIRASADKSTWKSGLVSNSIGPHFGELNSAVSPPLDRTTSEYRRLPRYQLARYQPWALRVCVSVTIAETAPSTGASIRPL
jgi:hypothetical protein